MWKDLCKRLYNNHVLNLKYILSEIIALIVCALCVKVLNETYYIDNIVLFLV